MERSEVKQQYKWKTEDIFSSDADWEKSYLKVGEAISFSQYSGKLGYKKLLL
ncbi:MAG: hypothetical protein K2N33_03215 [Clostridia bacterium]|nr:hypothetical protein [Clostridia bacterium]